MTECDPHAETAASVFRRRGVLLPGGSGYVGDLRGGPDE